MLITLDLSSPTGPVVTTGQLGRALGFSPDFIRDEIRAGEIRAAQRRGRGGRTYFRISWAEARRYARQLGVIS